MVFSALRCLRVPRAVSACVLTRQRRARSKRYEMTAKEWTRKLAM
jgi:hypothetical protein